MCRTFADNFRAEPVDRRSKYDYQLEAFRDAAINDGPVETDATSALLHMRTLESQRGCARVQESDQRLERVARKKLDSRAKYSAARRRISFPILVSRIRRAGVRPRCGMVIDAVLVMSQSSSCGSDASNAKKPRDQCV